MYKWRVVALLTTLWCSCFANAGALWFADDFGIHRVDTDTNAVTRDISKSDVQALAVDLKDGSLWALTSTRITKYNASGATQFSNDLGRNFNDARHLALDPSDSSVWAAGNNDIVHFNSNGHVLASLSPHDDVLDMAIAQDKSLWVLGDNYITHYSAQGAFLGKDNLEDGMRPAEFLALDDANSVLWVGGSRKVSQITLALPIHTLHARSTSENISALALDTATGNLWVGGDSSIFGFSKQGSLFITTDLDHHGVDHIQVLQFDTQSQALWVGFENGLLRVNATGHFVASVSAAHRKVNAISTAPGTAAPTIVPIVTLVSPPAGTLTGNAFVPIVVHYDATCNGQPCNFPSSTFAAYVLTATLNGASIGASFVFDATTNNAVYTPTVRYPEGVNSFSASVTDSSARHSATITSQFTVDTVAPHFVNVTPADGSSFVSPNITLQGSIDDLTGHVLLESFSGATFTGANPQGSSFSYAITLRPGANSFRLTANDPLGNVTQLSLTFTFSSLTLTVTSPANGAAIDDNKVTVTGTFSGATTATVTVNGIAAVVTGNTFTAADVPLNPGTNTLTVVGTSPQGAQDTKVVTVTSTAPSIAITSPANGATINGDSVLVRGTIQAPPNSGVSINGVVAAVDGANNFFAVVPLVPGANTLTAKVTSPHGSSASASISVLASGLPPTIVVTADPLSGMAPLTVTFTVTNPTAADATVFVDTFGLFGQFVLPAGGSASLPNIYPEGVFTATFVVNGGAAQSFVIVVTSIASMDAMLQALWHDIAGNLAAGNIEGALASFAPGMRDSYRHVLNDIAPALPAMFASFPPITATAMVDGDAEYFVPITRNGKKYGYFLYFMRDGDGIWRLHSL